ncbi:unnamed protein product, partial [Symbiodinium sp. CCMP2456]
MSSPAACSHASRPAHPSALGRNRRCPELAVARRCKLVEVGGRFSQEAVAFLRKLAKARAYESPARLRPAVQRASLHSWMGMLAVAAQRALAYALLELPLAGADECDGTEPPLGDLLAMPVAPKQCPQVVSPLREDVACLRPPTATEGAN